MAAGDDLAVAQTPAAPAAPAYPSADAAEADDVEALARQFLAAQAGKRFGTAETTAASADTGPREPASAPTAAANGHHSPIAAYRASNGLRRIESLTRTNPREMRLDFVHTAAIRPVPAAGRDLRERARLR